MRREAGKASDLSDASVRSSDASQTPEALMTMISCRWPTFIFCLINYYYIDIKLPFCLPFFTNVRHLGGAPKDLSSPQMLVPALKPRRAPSFANW